MDEPWTRAIARISVGGFRGTGFLVSDDGLILTAFHVIGAMKSKKLVPHASFIEVRFGDGKKATSSPREARLEGEHYSAEEDWALLRLVPAAATDPPFPVTPLPLARLTGQLEGRAFRTFGFPKIEADDGGEYTGTFGVWSEVGRIEAFVDNVAAGMVLGGISGGPCIVDGRVVAMILQSLADAQRAAVKSSFYIAPIERAMSRCAGLVAWDDGTDMTFQGDVQANLPDDADRLRQAGACLGLPEARRVPRQIARRLLSSRLADVGEALRLCALPPANALPILDRLGAMQIHGDAVTQLSRAGEARRAALVASETKRVQVWHVRRAYPKEAPRRIAVLRSRPGDEEAIEGSSLDTVVEGIVDRLRDRLAKQKVGATLLPQMFGAKRDDRARFWAVLIGESRFEVLRALAVRLPNAQVIGGSTAEISPSKLADLVDVVAPAMTADEELTLNLDWESLAADLDVPVELEEET
jgi:trypsin-like peptidase